MGLSGRTLPVLRIAGLTVAVSLVAAAGVGYWFFVSQQRDYIIGRDFRILTNLTKQIDSTAHAEALVIQNLPKQSPEEGLEPCETPGRNFEESLTNPPTSRSRSTGDRTIMRTAEPSFRAGSLMLEVPLENAGTQKLTASLNLQPALETLFNSTVGPRSIRRHPARHTRRARAGQRRLRRAAASFQRHGRAFDEGDRRQQACEVQRALGSHHDGGGICWRRRLHAFRRSVLPAGEGAGGSARAGRTRSQRQGARRQLGDPDHARENFSARAADRPCRMAISQARSARRSTTSGHH